MAATLAIAINAQAAVDYSFTFTAYGDAAHTGTGTPVASGWITVDSGYATAGSITVNGFGTYPSLYLSGPVDPILQPHVDDSTGLWFADGGFATLLWDGLSGTPYNYSLAISDAGYNGIGGFDNGALTLNPVPEPSTWIAGLGALGMLAGMTWRSRKA